METRSGFSIHRNAYPVDTSNQYGYWGVASSTLDWCEENYVTSFYIAEFWNTISNINYWILSCLGIWSCYQVGSEKRDYLAFLGLGIVGLGSFLFHMTLSYPMQLSDELPMIYCSCFLVFNYLNIEKDPSGWVQVLSSFFLLIYAATVTVVYEVTRIPVFFQVAYSLLALASAILPLIKIANMNPKNSSAKDLLERLLKTSLMVYLFGFFLWQVDNLRCDQVRLIRSWLPFPLNHLLQLHMWWHIFTGYGAFGSIVIVHYLRLLALGRKDFEMGHVLFYPYLRLKPKSS